MRTEHTVSCVRALFRCEIKLNIAQDQIKTTCVQIYSYLFTFGSHPTAASHGIFHEYCCMSDVGCALVYTAVNVASTQPPLFPRIDLEIVKQ
jgi:hypothetical protein